MSYRRFLIVLFVLPLFAAPLRAVAAPAEAPDVALLRKIEGVFIGVAEKIKPAVVSIRAERRLPPDDSQGKKGTPHGSVPQFASGSGVIIDASGLILTNNHVVDGAARLTVRLANGSAYEAKVFGTDRYTDLALVKIEPRGPIPVAQLGDSDKVRVGQWSIAVGDPFGITRTFTVGFVSGVGRTGVGVARYEYFIQTDAAINRGNSGGPLVNIDGEVIGINTAIPSPGSGIGFAVPINMAKDVIAHLRRGGTFTRGYLGVTIQPVANDMAHLLGLSQSRGALVGDLLADGPAQKSGVKAGDVIVEIDGKQVLDTSHLQRLVGWTPPGKAVSLGVIRGGRRRQLSVTLARLPDIAGPGGGPASRGRATPRPPAKTYGMELENLTPALMKKHQLASPSGVLIRGVESGGRAFQDGLRAGMAIREVTFRAPGERTAPVRVPIRGLDDFESLLGRIPPGSNVLARVARGTARGERAFFVVLHAVRPR